MKEKIVKAISILLKDWLSESDVEKNIAVPPSDDLGDYAFPCFALSKVLRKNPAVIAADIKERIGIIDGGKIRVESSGGYLNFFIDKRELAASVIENYSHAVPQSLADCGVEPVGMVDGRPVRAVVEFASPNTNKPLHLGHLRNMSIGDSTARILSFCGCEVFKASINNDRGVHICKSMLACKRCGNGATPQSAGVKSDHFVGDYYVMFNDKSKLDPSWGDDAQKMLKDWEEGEPETVELWKKMNKWALDGFRETYKLFGISFDREYYESDIYKNGKEIVAEGLDKGIFYKREDDAVAVNLGEEKLGGKDNEKVLLRPDGTSVYIVQDLYLALLKDKEFKYDKSIYVVGNEQDYHFAVLIAIFKKLGYGVGEKMKHLSYGMVELPEGKMKSREGTVVDADDLVTETKELAKKEVSERYEIGEAEAEERSIRIALAAVKYQLLKVDIAKNMVFDPKKAISFEGDTGPYLLYSYARASSILRKAGRSVSPVDIYNGINTDNGGENAGIGNGINVNDDDNNSQQTVGANCVRPRVDKSDLPETFEPAEIKLLKKIAFFPEAVSFAYNRLSSSVIANYAFDLAQLFNEFYHASQVIGSGGAVEAFRVNLVAAFRSVMRGCLELLGIEAVEEM
ncbi:MAG: arginine--tRNA ligase [Chitinispirillales bacterium]|nr:arginine--tRNA ligase [Chitinispirillales bacterium]